MLEFEMTETHYAKMDNFSFLWFSEDTIYLQFSGGLPDTHEARALTLTRLADCELFKDLQFGEVISSGGEWIQQVSVSSHRTFEQLAELGFSVYIEH